MKVSEFAKSILFGTKIEEKLIGESDSRLELDWKERSSPLEEPPKTPGRPSHLSTGASAKFPSRHSLKSASQRGRVLHFFANHELLAMEVMALTLLRFPEAPLSFRMGVFNTLREEQTHFKIYLERMRELGVDFGALPVSEYFWNAMKQMESPLDYVIQMSLCFEQANLDFSLFFRDEMFRLNDEKTGKILQKVYDDEIAHVRHGLAWFRKWSDPLEPEWNQFTQKIRPPMDARRAKGNLCHVPSRKLVGFKDAYIRELVNHVGSRGRSPVVWEFNPLCETEVAETHTQLRESQLVIEKDLACIPTFLAKDPDIVLVGKLPSLKWREEIVEAGLFSARFMTPEQFSGCDTPVGGVQPWGWSPKAWEKFRPLQLKLKANQSASQRWLKQVLQSDSYEELPFSALFSKGWSRDLFNRLIDDNPSLLTWIGEDCRNGEVIQSEDQLEARVFDRLEKGAVVLKAPFGTSANQIKRLRERREWQDSIGAWAAKRLRTQGSLIVEQQLELVTNFSMQMEILDDGVSLKGIRSFLNDTHWQFRGMVLGDKFRLLSDEERRFLFQGKPSVLDLWQTFCRNVGEKMHQEGYRGPAGVDAFSYRSNGRFFFRPLVEINPRWTMGRVGVELDRKINPGASALWCVLPKTDRLVETMGKFWVEKDSSGRIIEGVIWTNDLTQATSVVSVLAVGASASRLQDWVTKDTTYKQKT